MAAAVDVRNDRDIADSPHKEDSHHNQGIASRVIDAPFTNSVHVGSITGRVNLNANTVAGTITPPEFLQPLQGMAGIWGVF